MGKKSKEEHAAYCREWERRNPEKRRAQRLKWVEKNRERYNAKRKEYRRINREKVNAAKRKWEADNPDRVAASVALARIRRQRKQLASALLRNYDFTLENYTALLVAQANRCAICGRTSGNDKGHRLYVDHDHETGIVRGLLCGRCNSAIGYFEDDARRLRKAAAYVEGWLAKARTFACGGIQPVLGVLPEATGEARSH